ncbi:MAG: DUF1501 domain-containing protein [Gemmataceae bacterium]
MGQLRPGHAQPGRLPEYCVLGTPTGDCCGEAWTHGAGYLRPGTLRRPPERRGQGPAAVRPPARELTQEEQAANLSLLGKLNYLSGIDYPDDADLRARVKSLRAAFGMQTAVPGR